MVAMLGTKLYLDSFHGKCLVGALFLHLRYDSDAEPSADDNQRVSQAEKQQDKDKPKDTAMQLTLKTSAYWPLPRKGPTS
jgi:hypothetical protein